MAPLKPVQASPDLLAAAARPERYRPTVSIRTLKPSKDDEGTIEAAREFLESQWRLDGLTGIEYDYDGDGKTTMTLVADAQRESQTLSQFTSNFTGARLRTCQEPNLCISPDEYVAATEFRLSEDYWYPLLGVADEDFSRLRDPLGDILSSMAERGRSDVRYKLQVLAVPVPDGRWSRRWSVPYVFGGGLRDASMHSAIAAGSIGAAVLNGFHMLLGGHDNGRVGAASDLLQHLWASAEHTGRAVTSPLARLAGYSRDDLVNKHGHNVKALDDEATAAEQAEMEAQAEAVERIHEKASSHGFVATVRLVAVGDSKSEVEQGINGVATQVRDSFTPSGEASGVDQGLTYRRVRRSQGVKRIVSSALERSDGVDWHGRIEQREALRRLRTKRKKPVILSSKALAALLHPPEHPDVADPTVSWASGISSGNLSPDAPRHHPREE